MENYKYCPYCKETLIESPQFYKCTTCHTTLYKHPALTASVFPIKDKDVLLSRRGIEPKKGQIDAIGGFLRYGETPQKAAHREALEELGVEITDLNYLGTYHDKYEYQNNVHKTLNFMFTCKLGDQDIRPHDDVASIQWFPVTNIPKVAFDCVKQGLQDLQKKFNA